MKRADYQLGTMCFKLEKQGKTPSSLVWRHIEQHQKALRKKQMDRTRDKYMQECLSQQSTEGPASSQKACCSERQSQSWLAPEQLVPEYQADIRRHMLAEETLFSRSGCLQVDVNERARLVNWLVYVHGQIKLSPESLFLCV